VAFLNIFLGDTANYLAINRNQLQIKLKDGQERNIAVPDINSVIIDNNKIVISVYCLQYLADNNVAVYFCNERHLPDAMLLAYNTHYTQLKVFGLQNNMPKPLQKQLWSAFIKSKINNQALCLEILGKPENKLFEYAKNVVSGDTDNRESVSATLYWKRYFNGKSTRNSNCFVNSALNYGYSLIRGQIARSIVAHGLQPFLGIHHCNELNGYNLADDIIESYRPFVDLFVASNFDDDTKKLDANVKRKLLQILNLSIPINGGMQTLPNAVEITVESFVLSLKNNAVAVQLPNLYELKSYKYE
jgi:CRISPR-associated protein Cas1